MVCYQYFTVPRAYDLNMYIYRKSVSKIELILGNNCNPNVIPERIKFQGEPKAKQVASRKLCQKHSNHAVFQTTFFLCGYCRH